MSFKDDLGFRHRKVTPKWARANGEVERFVRTVKKVIKTAKLERKNYKQELNRFLRNYCTTPHSTTRVAPATALFGRPMKTKLPEWTTPCPNSEIQERDRAAKAKTKKHANDKCYVKPSTVEEGDVADHVEVSVEFLFFFFFIVTNANSSRIPYSAGPHCLCVCFT